MVGPMEDPIKLARRIYERSQEKLLDAYLFKLQEKYKGLNDEERLILLKNLETLLKTPFPLEIKESKEIFNETLSKIRLDLGLTQGELAKKLGINRVNLTKYERGYTKIYSRRVKSKDAKKYIEWLKEQGYNPRAI